MAESTQRSTRKRNGEAPPRKFVCQTEGCGRSFTRSEHLQRHLLNHTEGENTCERCRAHFKRRDLLDRHMSRHRQKDAEAGAEGCGVLNTRKRMWKDPDGKIVTKKPLVRGSPQESYQGQSASEPASFIQGHNTGAPISPPISHSNSYGRTISEPNNNEDLWRASQSNLDTNSHVHPGSVDERFWSASIAPPPLVQESVQDVPYDDIFNPDTASSFNMPFTTMSNYNWLFDLDHSPRGDHVEPSSLVSTNFQDYHLQESISEPHFDTPLDRMTFGGEISPVGEHCLLPSSRSDAAFPTQAFCPTLPPTVSPSFSDHDLDSGIGRASSSDGRSLHPSQTSESSKSYIIRHPDQAKRETSRPTTSHVALPPDMERPMASLQPSKSLPIIDEVARAQILELVDMIRPVTPDGAFVTRDHPLLTLSCLQTYCDLYFTRFNTAYPLIHQSTFDVSHVETLLLVSVLLLGATYGEKDAHQLAVCIHDVLRPQIFANAGFTAHPELWILQTILLVECFGKSRAGQKQHDMSHLFHGLLINLIRRSDCQSIRPPTVEQATEDLEDDWRTWVDAEQKKRLAFLCFMWDVQHAELFCQSLCMSAFELRSTLPCDQSLWEADSAEQWHQLRMKQLSAPLFLTVLKTYLTPGGSPAPRNLNALSRILLLHGLMSISWDMKRRDQTSLGLMESGTPIAKWRTRMANSYDAWKADFDAYCANYTAQFLTTSAVQANPHLQKEFTSFATAYTAIYHAAHVILDASFLDLQIYAGARHILGRPVARPDYVRSQRVVKKWVTEEREAASRAAWHAARLLRDGLHELDRFEARGLFHYPWCLYLATLTVWAFHHAKPLPSDPNGMPDSGSHHEDEDEIIWDVKAEVIALLNWMTNAPPKNLASASGMGWVGRKGTNGLTAVVCKSLSKVRWAVVHDGMQVLRGLVPWRLVSMYESMA